MSRWIRVQTSIFDHELFASSELSEREAWLWLIANVAWKETRHRIGSDMHIVPIGSIFITLRSLQSAWRWGSDKRVRTFISMLEREKMIEIKSDAGKTQITICNYSLFQSSGRKEDATETQQGRTEDALKTPVIPITPITSSSLRSEEKRVSAKPDFKAEFDREFWPIYPNKVGKPVALKAFNKARSSAGLPEIINGLRRYVAKIDDRAWCNPATWLNQERWNDQPAVMAKGQTGGHSRAPQQKTPFQQHQDAVQRELDKAIGTKPHDEFTGPTFDLEARNWNAH